MDDLMLADHFARLRTRLIEYAEHAGILAQHGDVKGAAREGFVRVFLQDNLPSLVEFKTGEIIDSKGQRSGQLDIVLQSIAAPRMAIFESIQTTMVDAAIAVIEVKSSLTTGRCHTRSGLRSALRTFQKVKALERTTPIHSLAADARPHTKTPCFLVAYEGPTAETLLQGLCDYSRHSNLAIDEYAPEVVCVLKPGYYVFRDDRWLFPRTGPGDAFRVWSESEDHCLIGLFVYICWLIETWNANAHLTPFRDYFAQDFKYQHHTA
jgi:hypothetical protein